MVASHYYSHRLRIKLNHWSLGLAIVETGTLIRLHSVHRQTTYSRCMNQTMSYYVQQDDGGVNCQYM